MKKSRLPAHLYHFIQWLQANSPKCILLSPSNGWVWYRLAAHPRAPSASRYCCSSPPRGTAVVSLSFFHKLRINEQYMKKWCSRQGLAFYWSFLICVIPCVHDFPFCLHLYSGGALRMQGSEELEEFWIEYKPFVCGKDVKSKTKNKLTVEQRFRLINLIHFLILNASLVL